MGRDTLKEAIELGETNEGDIVRVFRGRTTVDVIKNSSMTMNGLITVKLRPPNGWKECLWPRDMLVIVEGGANE